VGRTNYIVSGRLIREFCLCPRLPFMNRYADPREAEYPPERKLQWDFDFDAEFMRLRPVVSSPVGADGKVIVVSDVKQESPDDREAWTLAEMRKGAKEIYNGLLRWDNHWGCVPLMRKERGPSNLGKHRYSVYLMEKSPKKSSLRNSIPVAVFYSSLVERVQGVMPSVLLQRGYFDLLSVDPSEHLEMFNEVLASIDNSIGRMMDPGVALSSRCGTCIWQTQCDKDARAKGDLSLINGMRQESLMALDQHGIRTIAGLAVADASGMRIPFFPSTVFVKAVEQARAYMNGVPHITSQPVGLPPRSNLELFIDFEGLGENNRNDAFMFGVLVRRGRRVTYWASIAEKWNRKAFKAAWGEFIEHLGQYPSDIPLFHYASYERGIVKGMGRGAKLLGRLVDIYPIVRNCVSLPARGFSLKDVAKSLKFQWRADFPSGVLARELWYDSLNGRPGIRALRQYNEDDLKALLVVTDWLRQQPPT